MYGELQQKYEKVKSEVVRLTEEARLERRIWSNKRRVRHPSDLQ